MEQAIGSGPYAVPLAESADERRREITAQELAALDLAEQLDRAFAEQHKYQDLLRELLEAQRGRKSEQLSKEQLSLFEAA